jgi:hypothetical protein
MKLKSKRDKTQAQKFLEKFKKKKSYRMVSTPTGEIISVDTNDKEIIVYIKELGLE